MTPAEQLNPPYWTPERIERVRKASPRTFTMHILNEFGGAENAVIGKHELDACVARELPPGYVASDAMCAIDSSALKRDGFCGLFAFFANPDPRPRYETVRTPDGSEFEKRDEYGYRIQIKPADRSLLRIAEVFGFEPGALRSVRIEEVVRHLADRCRAWGVRMVFADHFEQTALGGLLSQHGLTLRPYHWSEESKADAIGGALRRYCREQTLSLVPHQKLYEELLSIREVPRAGGRWGYETGGKDFAAALISLFHGLADPDVVGVREGHHRRVHGVPHAGRAGSRTEIGPGQGRTITR